MSFSIYVSALSGGKLTTIKRSIVTDAFADLIGIVDYCGWQLTLPDWGLCSGHFYIEDLPEIQGFSINRPPLAPVFADALYTVMHQTPTVLMWPDNGPDPCCCVANPAVIREMPPDMIEALGMPTVVHSGEEIIACII